MYIQIYAVTGGSSAGGERYYSGFRARPSGCDRIGFAVYLYNVYAVQFLGIKLEGGGAAVSYKGVLALCGKHVDSFEGRSSAIGGHAD